MVLGTLPGCSPYAPRWGNLIARDSADEEVKDDSGT
jgi:hypothetical protein